MKLSTPVRYAIRILLKLRRIDRPMSIAAISELTGLPPRTVEKTHAVLRENGITSGTIGSMGGISLSVPLEKVSLGKLLEIFDNGVQFAACYGDKTNDCPNIPVCPRRGNWKDLSARVQKMLDGVCLAEVLDGHEGIAAAAERRL